MPERRFTPPWSIEEQAACFVVRDTNGQQLAYVYFENELGRRSAGNPIGTETPLQGEINAKVGIQSFGPKPQHRMRKM